MAYLRWRTALSRRAFLRYSALRAGLLTFWEQGCERFEQERESGTGDTRRSRSEFKNRIEDILRQAFAAFTKGEVAKSNGLPKEKDHLAWHWEETIEMSLDLMVYRQHA